MKVLVVVVGRVRGPLADAVQEYARRAERYWKLDVIEVAAGAGRTSDPESVRQAESERIVPRIPDGFDVVALTRAGKPMSSAELARELQDRALHAAPGIAFIVGGAFGLGRAVLERATRRVALGAMTLPHEMARLVLVEQLYRAGTILRGEPYHKG